MDNIKKTNLAGIFLAFAGFLGIYRSLFYHFPNGGLEIMLGITYLLLGITFFTIGCWILYYNRNVKVETNQVTNKETRFDDKSIPYH